MRKARLVGYGLATFLLVCPVSVWCWTHRPHASALGVYAEVKIGMSKDEVQTVFAKWGMAEPPPLGISGLPLIVKAEPIESADQALYPVPFWWNPGQNGVCAAKGKYYVVCDLSGGKVWDKHLYSLGDSETLFDKIARWLHL